MQFSLNTTPTFMKINIQVFATCLNNFQLINEVDFIWPKWRLQYIWKKKFNLKKFYIKNKCNIKIKN